MIPERKSLNKLLNRFFEVTGRNPLLDIAIELERIALQDEYFVKRKLYRMSIFIPGIIYQAMGFPAEFFTVRFRYSACGRLACSIG